MTDLSTIMLKEQEERQREIEMLEEAINEGGQDNE